MRFIVYGAGGIGATIGARLHQSGSSVVLIARGDHARMLQQQGLNFVAPDGQYQLQIPCLTHPREVDWQAQDVVILAVKSQHTVAALADLTAHAPANVPVVCAQNGVANERMALRRGLRVYGMVVNLPALHLNPGEVVTHASGTGGILDVGCFPLGSDDVARRIAEHVAGAGFSCIASERVMRWKYAKLLMNLGNALQAAVTPADMSQDADSAAAAGAVAKQLRREALACFSAASIDCATREEVVARHEQTYQMVDIDGYPRTGGSSWQSVHRGTGDIETDFLNGEVLLLGGLHGVATPANRVVAGIARQMIARQLPVGSFNATDILNMIEAAAEEQQA